MNFLTLDQGKECAARLGIDARVVGVAISAQYLPTFLTKDGKEVLLAIDIETLPCTWETVGVPGQLALGAGRFDELEFEFSFSEMVLPNGCRVRVPPLQRGNNLAVVFAALRGLLPCSERADASELWELQWPFDVRIVGRGCERFRSRAIACRERMERSLLDKARELTKSAYYMGSKAELASFIVESVAPYVPEGSAVVDVMCGSGAMSRAFALNWDVFACDGMMFCVLLARSFSKLSSATSVDEVWAGVLARFEDNVQTLSGSLGAELRREEEFLSCVEEYSSELVSAYSEFCDASKSQHEAAGARFRGNKSASGYNLFCEYYRNMFFGVRQCVEIDSIRCAIDGIVNEDLRGIMLGALIATLSYVGTGYASQFAQPVSISGLSKRAFYSFLERRATRVVSEFLARAKSIERICRASRYKIVGHSCGWRGVSEFVQRRVKARNVFCYVDAPYTRDEYSRYYHVLESLVRYDYPEVSGRGRVRTRDDEGFFRSEFFTRSEVALPSLLGEVILSCVRLCGKCAWSYSSHARASVIEVVDYLVLRGVRVVASYCAPHEYKAQGGGGRRRSAVVEWVFVFEGTLEGAT